MAAILLQNFFRARVTQYALHSLPGNTYCTFRYPFIGQPNGMDSSIVSTYLVTFTLLSPVVNLHCLACEFRLDLYYYLVFDV